MKLCYQLQFFFDERLSSIIKQTLNMKGKFTLTLILIISCLSIQGQNWDQIIKTASSTRQNPISPVRTSEDYFGYSVAIDANYAVVSAFGEAEDELGKNNEYSAGSVIIFKNIAGAWQRVKKIVAADRGAYDYFGASVAISGNTIVVGAYGEDDDADGTNSLKLAGAAYIFNKDQGGTDNWGQVKKLVTADRAIEAYFGNSVDISGNTVIVGALRQKTDAAGENPINFAGAAYIFNKDQAGVNNWGQVKKIVPTIRDLGELFGTSVSISEDLLLIGAPLQAKDASGANTMYSAGAAYIFSKDQGGSSNWGQVKKLTASDRAAGANFGSSVAINENTIVIGAEKDEKDASGTNILEDAGSAYVFIKAGFFWLEAKKIVASNRASGDQFGHAVAIDGNRIVVGAFQVSDKDFNGTVTASHVGAAYIFSRSLGGTNNWGLIKKIESADRRKEDFFGYAVGLSGTTLFAGAYNEGDDAPGVNKVSKAGASYVFNKDNGGTENWGPGQKLILEEIGENQQQYGNSVCIDGEYAVVGASLDLLGANGGPTFTKAGSVYVLKNTNGVWKEVKKITADDRATEDVFGKSVAIDGNTIIVGAPHPQYNIGEVNRAGAAYIFNKNQGGADNWGMVKKLVSENFAIEDLFGDAVAISGSTVVIGAPRDPKDAAGLNSLYLAGAAYIFKEDQSGVNNWGQVKKLVAQDRATGDNFGNAVAISDDDILVGAHFEDEDATGDNTLQNSGSVYAFSKNEGGSDSWGQVKKIVSSDRGIEDGFGYSIAISGSTIIVGAYAEDEDAGGINTRDLAGSAYIFKKDEGGTNNWGQVKKIVAADRGINDVFGFSVAISGTTAIVGAVFEDEDENGSSLKPDAGSAYIFSKDEGGADNWGQVKKIVSSDRNNLDYFGAFVGISGNTAIVGAIQNGKDAYASNQILNSGAAYFFKNCANLSLTTVNSMSISSQKSGNSNYYDNNCNLLATLKSEISNPLAGHTRVNVWIEPTQPIDFVKRHYEIAPANTVPAAVSIITLYFTQQEFDHYNAVNIIKLPTNSTDATGKSNLFIENRTGNSSNGSGLPNTYSYPISTIDPVDAEIIFNTIENRWEVSFVTAIYGGFFAKSTMGILPVKWLNISGSLNANNQAEISWQVAENEVRNFELQRSANGSNFTYIATLASKGDGTNTYNYTDGLALANTSFYRVKQTSTNGSIDYSAIVKLNPTDENKISLYPNPVQDKLMISGVTPGSILLLTDATGKLLQKLQVIQTIFNIDMSRYSAGMYLLKNAEGKTYKIIKQ